jgi:uncharacterized protein (TIGR02266 family)
MKDQGRERRRLKRFRSRVPALLLVDGKAVDAHVKNLSKEGLFLRTDQLPEPGASVQVLLKPGDGRKIELNGTVRWTTKQYPGRSKHPGFGLLFDQVTDEYLQLYEDILTS